MFFRINIVFKEFFKVIKEEAEKEFDALELVYPNEIPLFEKYDEFLPPELVKKGFAYGVLDFEGAKERIKEIISNL